VLDVIYFEEVALRSKVVLDFFLLREVVHLLLEYSVKVLYFLDCHLVNGLIFIEEPDQPHQELLAVGYDALYVPGAHENLDPRPVLAVPPQPFEEELVLIVRPRTRFELTLTNRSCFSEPTLTRRRGLLRFRACFTLLALMLLLELQPATFDLLEVFALELVDKEMRALQKTILANFLADSVALGDSDRRGSFLLSPFFLGAILPVEVSLILQGGRSVVS